MTAHYADEQVTLYAGDCLDVLRSLPDCSVDAVVTDPPYELGFMGRAWDASGIAYNVDLWRECLRVLRPGGHLAAFGGTRTYHRMACAVEDAGFEIRDSLQWLYGSGFPKSLDVSKAIDKAAGAEPVVLGPDEYRRARANRGTTSAIQPSYDKPRLAQAEANITAPATDAAREWSGWGTALKPAHEPIVLARKPLSGTVAANVLQFGTGALNIDATRVGSEVRVNPAAGNKPGGASYNMSAVGMPQDAAPRTAEGRWPANVLLTHAPDCDDSACQPGCPVSELDAQSGPVHTQSSASRNAGSKPSWSPAGAEAERVRAERAAPEFGDVPGQGASRFFPSFRYQAKAPTSERPKVNGVAHPTCKPLAVMAWLVKLLTPPGGTVLEPFAGSGTTIEAAMLEGFRVIGIEREADYLPLIEHRIARARETAAPPEEAAPALFDIGEAS